MTSSIGNFILYDWRVLIKAFLKPGKYLQWMMWFHDLARDHANKNARAATPQNQLTFEILTDTRQFDTIEAQIQCPPLLHKQLKTVALKTWDRITPQEEPTGSYTKILQGRSKNYADILARLETAISRTVIGDKTKKTAREISCLWECKSKMSEIYHSNSWDWEYYWLFKGLLQSRIRNSKDTNASWDNGCWL